MAFIALRLDPDPTVGVAEIDLLVPLWQRDLRNIFKRATDASPFSFTYLKSSLISSTVIVGLVDGDTLRLVSLDIRGPILKRQARYSLSFSRVRRAGVRRSDSFSQPAPRVESALLVERNRIDGRLPNAKHERILAATEESIEPQHSVWSSRFRQTLRVLGLLAAVQKKWFALLRGRRSANIAFHGPDGSGKTTVANAVAATLNRTGIKASTWHYLKQTQDVQIRPSGISAPKSRLNGTWVRRFSWPYLATKAILRTRVSNCVLVHDRYVHDILEKDLRKGLSRTRAVSRIISFVSGYFSTPFLLESPIERMLDRAEQTPEEMEASAARAQQIHRIKKLNGSLPPERLAAQAVQHWHASNAVRSG